MLGVAVTISHCSKLVCSFTIVVAIVMLTNILQGVWVFSALALVVLILLHSPKGEGFSIGGQAQMFTSTKSAETALNRATWIMTVLFMGLTVVLSAGWIAS